jgi:phosphoglycerol transferase MdoB-like AlkP superfamily enzyme
MKLYQQFIFYLYLLSVFISVSLLVKASLPFFSSYLSLDFLDFIWVLFWGLRFDLAAVAFFILISWLLNYILIRLKIIKSLNIIVHIPFIFLYLAILVGDGIYFFDSGRHVGYEVFNIIFDIPALLSTLWQDYLFVFFIFICLSFLIFLVLLKIQKKKNKKSQSEYGFKPEIGLFLLVILSVVFIRGGLQNIPQNPTLAYELNDDKKAVLAQNGAYNVIFAILTQTKPISPVAVHLNHYQSLHYDRILQEVKPQKEIDTNKHPNKYNVVMIFLESWAAKNIKSYGNTQDAAPFFDKLRKKSLSTTTTFAAGLRTTEGIFASLCAWQNPLGKSIVASQLEDFSYECLPHILNNNGWMSIFLQGTNRNSSSTGSLVQKLGFRKSYGRDSIKQNIYPIINWGAQDIDIYNFALEKMQNIKQPFLVGINTNTTHSTLLPDGVEYKFGKQTYQQKRLSVMHFADEALRMFFANYHKLNLNKTIFVIVSDHTIATGATIFDKYRVPFLIYGKDFIQAQLLQFASSQRNIAPTILELLNFNTPPSFGARSLFNLKTKYADYFHNGILGWAENNDLIEKSISSDNIKCYKIINNKNQTTKCTENHQQMANRASIWTHYNQKTLFAGKLKQLNDEK